MKEPVNIYSLENPIIWSENEQLLLVAVLRSSNIAYSANLTKDLFFEINPVSGWIFFEMQNQLWTTFQKGTLPTAEEATKVAYDFIQKLIKESMTEEFKSKKIPPNLLCI